MWSLGVTPSDKGLWGVMDQGSTFGPQGTPTPSQEEIKKCTPTPPLIPHSHPKPLPTCPQPPYVPMPPHIPTATSPTFTSRVTFSCAAFRSCSLWPISPHPPCPPKFLCLHILNAPHITFTYICALHLLQLRSSHPSPSTVWLYGT